MDVLPAELIFQVAGFLEAVDIARVQLVCKRLHQITRDNKLWKPLCFDDSQAEALRRRRELIFGALPVDSRVLALQRAASSLTHHHNESGGEDASPETPAVSGGSGPSGGDSDLSGGPSRARAIASWDPSYPGERVDWYQEYIHRHGPISFRWLQQPFYGKRSSRQILETRGMACLGNDTEYEARQDTTMVAPLDDGSVCLWDVWGHSFESGGRAGKILARSKSGLLSVRDSPFLHRNDRSSTRAEMTSTGVVECVSVDNHRKRAYFAVQSGLNEVDLTTLQVVSHRRFPFSISTISEARFPVPLTVGTSLSLHLHDPRENARDMPPSEAENDRCKPSQAAAQAQLLLNDTTMSSYSRASLRYAPLFQPGPVSILHLPGPDGLQGSNDEIYVAGRFPSVLHYDRRYWPRLHRTIHSGARLSGLAWFPYASQSLGATNTVQSVTGANGDAPVGSQIGNTLAACGEYNGKGSLELYGLASTATSFDDRPVFAQGNPKIANFKNRHTASRSKLLSVANHGTRLVFSDGDGNLKWMERDGSIDVRQWNINSALRPEPEPRGLFPRADGTAGGRDSGDVARKILSVRGCDDAKRANTNDLMIWSGERIGHLSFSGSSALTERDDDACEDDESDGLRGSVNEAWKVREEEIYGQTMRRALERQADEVRFVRGLGLGSAPNLEWT
ncbi:MAG: Ubiquitin-conjugating enzyme E2 11 [Chaenotheca gracillima]|nr:MAG: Ubiquitin-conjugating enzyme E2 11 [Chaenotheca gracillima]